MNKNEIVARFMGAVPAKNWQSNDGWKHDNYAHSQWSNRFQDYIETDVYTKRELKYDTDRNWLHEAWVKFRDLKFYSEIPYATHDYHRYAIKLQITEGTITEAFDELVKGIIWYESLKK